MICTVNPDEVEIGVAKVGVRAAPTEAWAGARLTPIKANEEITAIAIFDFKKLLRIIYRPLSETATTTDLTLTPEVVTK